MSISAHLLKIYSILLLLVLTLISSNGVVASGGGLLTWLPTRSRCTLSECLDEEEFQLSSEVSRRILATTKYISYGALKRNTVPCSKRGASYYNCRTGAQANPYTRGCSAITKCRS